MTSLRETKTSSRSRKKFVFRTGLTTVAFVLIVSVIYSPLLIIQGGYWIISVARNAFLLVPKLLTKLVFGHNPPFPIESLSIVAWCLLLYLLIPIVLVVFMRTRRR